MGVHLGERGEDLGLVVKHVVCLSEYDGIDVGVEAGCLSRDVVNSM